METKEILSYRAINVFIEREYLEKIISFILKNAKSLPKEDQIEFNSHFNKYVKILGFRNPLRAPLSLQINGLTTAFEEKEEIIPKVLTTWTILNSPFSKIVSSWLEAEGWNNLKFKRIYSPEEGFIADWPKNFSFDQLDENFKKANPELKYEKNDLILMALWLSGKLPK